MAQQIVLDGRNIYEKKEMEEQGFIYHCIGLMSGKLFMSSEKIQKLSYIPRQGDVLKCYYDRYGKPVEFVPYEGDEF